MQHEVNLNINSQCFFQPPSLFTLFFFLLISIKRAHVCISQQCSWTFSHSGKLMPLASIINYFLGNGRLQCSQTKTGVWNNDEIQPFLILQDEKLLNFIIISLTRLKHHDTDSRPMYMGFAPQVFTLSIFISPYGPNRIYTHFLSACDTKWGSLVV